MRQRVITIIFWSLCFVSALVGFQTVVSSPLLKGEGQELTTGYITAWIALISGCGGILLTLRVLAQVETAEAGTNPHGVPTIALTWALMFFSLVLSLLYALVPVINVYLKQQEIALATPAGVMNAFTFIPLFLIGFAIGATEVVLAASFYRDLKAISAEARETTARQMGTGQIRAVTSMR